MNRTIVIAAAAVGALALTACAPAPAEPGDGTAAGTTEAAAARAAAADVARPPPWGVFDYQLGGASDALDGGDEAAGIDVVVRDATAEPLEGAYSVCYVNGYQTQPDDAAFWLEHDDLLLKDASGDPLIDPDWPDEYILDPSTSEQRDGILEILGPVISGCADAGFDAVEIDNFDTWTRFDAITEEGAHALAGGYVDLAHESGMAIAQKNAAEVTEAGYDEIGFDFAVTEECGVWDECAAYTDVYGDHVLQIEYPDALEEAGLAFSDVCERDDRAPLTILRDRDLVASDEDAYVYESC
ncbi:MAG: endo alpha-1,4 polygalactosaminidase [Microbacterium sp.]